MECGKTDCLHNKVCNEWKLLGNDNYINDSYGNCDFYERGDVSLMDDEKRAMYMSLEELRDYAYNVATTKVRMIPGSSYPTDVFASAGDWKKLYEYLQELVERREGSDPSND